MNDHDEMREDYGDALKDGVRGKYLPFCLGPVSAPRLERLFNRHPEVATWPVFKRLRYLQTAKGEVLEMGLDEIDAIAALLLLINAQPDVSAELFDRIFDMFLRKAPHEIGPNFDAGQFADLAYEGQVGLLLARQLPQWLKVPEPNANQADLVFSVQFYTHDMPTEYAIECKNVRAHTLDVGKQAIAVARAIRKAVRQHNKRGLPTSDLIVFVDLPIGTLSYTKRQFYTLIVNTWRNLEKSPFGTVDESQVVFTATWQENMTEHILESNKEHRQLAVFVPHTVAKTGIWISAARTVFLTALFRAADDTHNVENWSKYAVNISDPENYVLD